MEASLPQNALSFYQWVKRADGQATAYVYIQMAKCFLANGLEFKAEECLRSALQVDEDNIEARVELAKIYEASNQRAPAAALIKEAMDIEAKNKAPPPPTRKYRKRDRDRKERKARELLGLPPESSPPQLESLENTNFLNIKRPKNPPRRRQHLEYAEVMKEQTTRTLGLQGSYSAIRTDHEKMLAGDTASTRRWMEAAKTLTDEFRGFKPFYPVEKYVRFTGYSGEHLEHAHTPIGSGLVEMADRLSQSMIFPNQHDVKVLMRIDLGEMVANTKKEENVPTSYRGISFREWLDMFLEYALCLARHKQVEESYAMCQAASDSNVWCHSREDMFTIHITWLSRLP